VGTKVGQNWYQPFHYDILFCRQVSLTLPQGTPSREFHAALLLFDAIPTCWVSKDNSVGLQRQSSNAVAAQRRCIPKCVVKTLAGIITASVLRRCNCAASMCPKMLPRGEKLVWRIFCLHVISHIFYCKIFPPIGLHKNTASGWLVTKISQPQQL
jgi:hypothetical protein